MPNAPAHSEIHTYNYETWVNTLIDPQIDEHAVRAALTRIRGLLRDGKQPKQVTAYWEEIGATFESVEGVTEGSAIPDVTVWIPGALAMSNKAKDRLESSLAGTGEFLPVQTPAGQFWLFNCQQVVSANENRSERLVENGAILDISSLAFDDAYVQRQPVFKTDFDGFR